MVSYCAPRRRRCFRGCADGTRSVHVSAHRPAPAVQPRGSSTAHPSVPDLPHTPTATLTQPASQLHLMNAHAIVNLPRGEGPKSEAAVGFVTGMLGKCVRLAVLHVCFSKFGPTKTRFCCFFVLFFISERSAGKVRVWLRVRRRARGAPGGVLAFQEATLLFSCR